MRCSRPVRTLLRNHFVVPAFVLALLLPAPLFAVAPPVPFPEMPAPGPLLVPEPVHVNSLHLSLAVFGASAQPGFGPVPLLGNLFAGEMHHAWNLEGAMTNRYSRISVGIGTLVLGGTAPVTLGLAGTLQVGQHLDCWALIDTDRFRALPTEWLKEVTDGQGIGLGGIEADIYSRVLIRANYTSSAAFKKAARRDITYVHLSTQPERYRGVVVRVEGILRRINRYDPTPEAMEAGVNDLYEAWVYNEQFGANPYCVIFTEWPAGLSRDLLGKHPLEEPIRVALDGYFFKKYRYTARAGVQRDTPLIMGHGLIILDHKGNTGSRSEWWISSLIYGFAGVLGTLVVGVAGLTYWYRRSDNRVRRRIVARMPEFALPPPDAPPMAVPVGSAARPPSGAPRPAPVSRIVFPPGLGDRGREPPHGEGDSGKKPPPDEGAGA